MGGEGTGGERKGGEGKGEEGREERRREGEGRGKEGDGPLLTQIPGSAPAQTTPLSREIFLPLG